MVDPAHDQDPLVYFRNQERADAFHFFQRTQDVDGDLQTKVVGAVNELSCSKN